MTRQRWFLLIMAFLLIALSWWGVVAARRSLTVRALERDRISMLYVAPQGAERVPGVLVAHGFAGSKQLMLGYAHVLAHAGYAVILWDFAGHGANPTPMERGSLQQDFNTALAALRSQPEVDPSRLALLGHSMGSGVVMSASIRDADQFAATIAVSPTGAEVTPQVPRNLQLQVGGWEGRFANNAERLLKQAGGENQQLAAGKGRSLITIPNAEHITILFRDTSHQAALKWLDATFRQAQSDAVRELPPSSYVDRRIAWYGLHLLGWLLALVAIAPSLSQPNFTLPTRKPRPRQRWAGLLLAPLVASSALALISRAGEIQNLGGLVVGGAIALWFLIAGAVWLGILSYLPRLTLRAVGLGIALFILLWIAFGGMAQFVWLQWWLIPARLQLWPLLSLACLPWFLASGLAQQGVSAVKRVAWWLGQSLALMGGFLLVLYLVPQLFFIFLLLPLFPVIMAILCLVASQLDDEWSYAIGSACFFGWILAAAFPLGS
jgi:dienelactone hydrolase